MSLVKVFQSYHIVDNMDMFIERIVNENLWDYDYTLSVIEEYKKFVYLTTLDYVSPSFEIDQVWHTHMLFTKDYKKMCDQIGKFLHHDPIDKKLPNRIDPYPLTLKLYKRTFGYNPPSEVWTQWRPSRYCYINMMDNWVIPRGNWKMIMSLLINNIKNKLYGNS